LASGIVVTALDILSVTGMVVAFFNWLSVQAALREIRVVGEQYRRQYAAFDVSGGKIPRLHSGVNNYNAGMLFADYMPWIFFFLHIAAAIYTTAAHYGGPDLQKFKRPVCSSSQDDARCVRLLPVQYLIKTGPTVSNDRANQASSDGPPENSHGIVLGQFSGCPCEADAHPQAQNSRAWSNHQRMLQYLVAYS
jgi:hypothetical protein